MQQRARDLPRLFQYALFKGGDQLWCRFTKGNLVANFLDSRGEGFDLFLLLCTDRLLSRNLLLLLGDGRFEFRYCALLFCDVPVLFQELIQQHRVYGFVADGVSLSHLHRELRGN